MATLFNRWIVLICLLVIGKGIFAQSPPWQRINPNPFECSVNDAQLLEDGRIIAVGSGSSVLISENFGSSWDIKYSPADILYKTDLKSVCFIDEDKGWAVGSRYTIIRTEDGGLNWVLLHQGSHLPYRSYCDVEFISDSEGFVIEDSFSDNLLKTHDAGQTWDTVPGLENYSFTQIQFVNADMGYMHGSDDYILKSIDAGSSWQKYNVNPGVDNFSINTLHFLDQQTGFVGATVYSMSNHEQMILKTEDGGNSWEQVFFDYAHSSSYFSFINADTGYSVGPVVWYSNNILRTINGGNSWDLITDDLGYWGLVRLCSDQNGNVLALGGNGQEFNSYNYGLSWIESFSNIIFAKSVVSSVILDDSSILISAEGGPGGAPSYKNIMSQDRGNTWTETENYDGIVYDLHFINDMIGFYCGGYDYGGANNMIFKTTNGGLDWEFVALGTNSTILKRIEFIDDSTGFVGGMSEDYGYFVLYKTTNCGESWEEVELGYYAEWYGDFDFYNDSSALITGEFYPWDSSASILRTTDMGNSWTKDTLPFVGDFSHVYFMNPDTGILFGFNKICKTVDGGTHWYQVDFEMDEYVNLDLTYRFTEGGKGYLYLQGTNTCMFKTDDYGDTWYEIDGPTSSVITTINFFDADEGILAGEDGIIFITQTGGIVTLPEWSDEKENQLLIYPNPSQGNFSVGIPEGYETGVFYVYDLQGKLIDMAPYNSSGIMSVSMNLRKGIYVLKIQSGRYSITGKLVIIDP